MGWVICESAQIDWPDIYRQYAKDIVADPFYRRFEKRPLLLWIYALHAIAFFGAGFLAGALTGGLDAGLQLGLSLLVWGVFVRTVAVWHITWLVNSAAHTWGYRNYETRDNSRNNWVAALLSNGDGWHNNHHAIPRAADHGQRWFEFDVAYTTIHLLEWIGLADHVVRSRRVASVPATAK
jgi:stearoyl-CoA desaturase (delta-9 desaturase)